MARVRAVSFAVAVIAAAGGPAAAEERVAVVAHRAAAAPASAEAVRDAVAGALGAGAVVDPFGRARDGLAAGATPVHRLEAFRRAARLIDEGWRAYLAVQKTFARDRLGPARQVAEEVLDLEGGRELYAEASLRLGLVLLDLGDAGEAADLFRLARTLDPVREIGTAEFHPDVVKAIETAAAASVPVHRVILEAELEGGGAGATVEVDGRAAGSAPATVELGAGQHVMVVRRPGFVPRGQAFLVPGGGAAPVSISIALERDPGAAAVLAGDDALAVGRSDADARVAVDGLLLWGELDGVLLAAAVWRRGQPALLGQLCLGAAAAPLRCTQVEEVGYPRSGPDPGTGALAAAARQLVARLRGARGGRSLTPYLLIDRRLVDGEKDPGTGVVVPGGRPWYRNPYLWVGVGAAALAGGAWALLGRDTTVTPVIDTDPCHWVGICPSSP